MLYQSTSCSSVCQPLVAWEVGFPGGTAQVAVMSLERSASRTICPGFCPYFIYVMKYILPLIMGSREDKKHLQRMESNIAAMSGTLTQTVSQLQQTLVSVQELLIQQQQKIQELSQELAAAE
ncbi:hypothetical protein INR49_022423, partial [Caranx melampygus]